MAPGSAFAEVVGALQAYFDGLHQANPERFSEVWHAEGRMYAGDASSTNKEQFLAYIASREKCEHLAVHDKILKIDIIGPNCVLAKVQIALTTGSPPTEVLYTDFLVLLKSEGRWQIISKIYASVPLSEGAWAEPPEVANPATGVAEYYRGGHLSQPEVMGESFHEVARLCFVDQDDKLVIWSRQEFFERLKSRPPTADDPVALKYDKIIDVDKSGPDNAVVKCMIGYPPLLYVDILSMLRIKGRWWIIAKSSSAYPWPSA